MSKSAVPARQAFPPVILTPYVLDNNWRVTNDFANTRSKKILGEASSERVYVSIQPRVVITNNIHANPASHLGVCVGHSLCLWHIMPTQSHSGLSFYWLTSAKSS